MKKINRTKWCLLIILLSTCFYTNTKFSTQLMKLFYNKGDVVFKRVGEKKEYGNLNTIPAIYNVVFYFSNKPIINYIPTNKKMHGNLEQKVFIFPKAIVDNKIYKKIARKIKKENNRDLHLQLKPIMRPIDGIKLVITYNPQKVMITYKAAQAVSQYKAIVFSFQSKPFKERMEHIQDAILRTVLYKKKRGLLSIVDMEGSIMEGSVLG